MRAITETAKVTVKATIELSEEELRALCAMSAYGTEEFLNAFYKNLGKSALQPYEAGVRSLFEAMKTDEVRNILSRASKAREAFSQQTKS